jgi:hypothetical protein
VCKYVPVLCLPWGQQADAAKHAHHGRVAVGLLEKYLKTRVSFRDNCFDV